MTEQLQAKETLQGVIHTEASIKTSNRAGLGILTVTAISAACTYILLLGTHWPISEGAEVNSNPFQSIWTNT